MQASWRTADHTILALTDATGHVVIVEPGHALWAAAVQRPDIAPFAIEAFPDPSPEDLRATLPPLTRRQLFIALHRLGLITASEAVAAAATGMVDVDNMVIAEERLSLFRAHVHDIFELQGLSTVPLSTSC